MRLTYKTYFHAAHFLPGHKTCGKMHGHTYHVEVDYEGQVDGSSGMVKDSVELKVEVEAVLSIFDHKVINEVMPSISPPTAERIASAILQLLRSTHDQPVGREYKAVRLWETPSFCVEARP